MSELPFCREPATVDVVFAPDLVPFADLTEKVVVAIDILRATSTITTALANGATSVTPVLTPAEALSTAKRQANTLCCGEREGRKVDGFSLGNSPREFTPENVANKHLVATTTNGTRTIRECLAAKHLLLGSFLNRWAVVEFIQDAKSDVVFVCACRIGQFCTEDSVFAGACLSLLSGWQQSDAAKTALLLYQHHQADLLAMLKQCDHGRYLESIDLAEDLDFCAQVDLYPIVPQMIDSRIQQKTIDT